MAETWVINETISMPQTYPMEANFVSNNKHFDAIDVTIFGQAQERYFISYSDEMVYEGEVSGGYSYWYNEAYRTVTFETPPTGDLLTWLQANAVKQGGGGSTLDVTYNSQKIIDSLEVTPPVTVTYNGGTIATMNAGDTKTLQCNGKVMASNVVIGGKTLQCNGKLMASDVVIEVGGVTPTGETWVINDEVPRPSATYSWNINFESNDTKYYSFVCERAGFVSAVYYNDTIVYASIHGWTDEAYRTVTFETPPTGDLLTWLQANAVKQ